MLVYVASQKTSCGFTSCSTETEYKPCSYPLHICNLLNLSLVLEEVVLHVKSQAAWGLEQGSSGQGDPCVTYLAHGTCTQEYSNKEAR